ncbi:MAG: PQQ-dependent dehydrogenase, methanol/ethanol family [Pseudomonadota bacterium]|nr:PQQ-dependent dehydrogenase, methanol/ethanol family [Pseudomonadota bacterium]
MVLGVVFLASGMTTNPKIHWRTRLVGLKLQGLLPHVGWAQMIKVMGPKSGAQKAESLIDNPYASAGDVAKGNGIFREKCTGCHGLDATGGDGPDLTQGYFRHGGAAWALFRTVSRGVPRTAMPGFPLSEREIWQVVAYVQSLSQGLNQGHVGGSAAEDKGVRCPPCLSAQVSYEHLRNASQEAGNWVTYSGSYDGHHHSSLDQIHLGNIRNLRLKWVYQMPTVERVKATPLVINGVIYVAQAPNDVVALDTATGRPFWSYKRALPERVPVCCGKSARGLAMLGDRLYLGTFDGRLVALDAKTGSVIWDVEVGDYRTGHSITGIPLAVKDKIIVGVALGEMGIRGYIDAYDAQTGKRVWRFYTIPAPGEPGNETWEGDSWKTGGAAVWLTGSFDPDLNLTYWGAANPSPTFNGEVRKGDNLYSDSMLALDADSGKLKWHFQFTPHDVHDFDAVQIPVLVDAQFRDSQRKLMLYANNNGFFYLLDRESGEFLLARQFAKQTWADGIDGKGRPIRRPDMTPTAEGTLTYPDKAALWFSPSYHPSTGLFYVSVIESGLMRIAQPVPKERLGIHLAGGFFTPVPGAKGMVRAIIPESGEVKWEYQNCDEQCSGLLSTGGDLVFGGNHKGSFFALNASTGQEVLRVNIGGWITAAPITYLSDRSQQVTVTAGNALFTFALE